VNTKWKDLRQGDSIKVLKDEIVPADCLLLLASSASGFCYVETASLDGEKNLKPKVSNALIQQHYNEKPSLGETAILTGRILCSAPSANL
jgi:phospholipid-transporting ATPase